MAQTSTPRESLLTAVKAGSVQEVFDLLANEEVREKMPVSIPIGILFLLNHPSDLAQSLIGQVSEEDMEWAARFRESFAGVSLRWALAGMADVVECALASIPDAEPHPKIFMAACKHGRTEIVRILLEDGRADPSANEQGALVCAACYGHSEILELVLADPRTDPAAGHSMGPDAAFDSSGALCAAAIAEKVECVRVLLADGRSDPAAALEYPCTPEVEELLRAYL